MKKPEHENTASTVVNDNKMPLDKTITFTELAKTLQIDEDTLLRKLAMILCNREDNADQTDEKE